MNISKTNKNIRLLLTPGKTNSVIQETYNLRIPPDPPRRNNGNIEYCSAKKRTSLGEGGGKVCLLFIVDENM